MINTLPTVNYMIRNEPAAVKFEQYEIAERLCCCCYIETETAENDKKKEPVFDNEGINIWDIDNLTENFSTLFTTQSQIKDIRYITFSKNV